MAYALTVQLPENGSDSAAVTEAQKGTGSTGDIPTGSTLPTATSPCPPPIENPVPTILFPVGHTAPACLNSSDWLSELVAEILTRPGSGSAQMPYAVRLQLPEIGSASAAIAVTDVGATVGEPLGWRVVRTTSPSPPVIRAPVPTSFLPAGQETTMILA